MSFVKRIISMALFGAVGAVAGALIGEALFRTQAVQAPVTPKSICMLFDTSGSMKDATEDGRTQLAALKAAANDFVARQDLERDALGLISFASKAHKRSAPVHEGAPLQSSISKLAAGGGTNLGGGLEEAGRLLAGAPGDAWILLFSDGKPQVRRTDVDAEAHAVQAAERVRAAGVQIVAIGTGLADRELLERVTGSPEHVILSDFAALPEAFETSEEVIHNRQMLAMQAGSADYRTSVRQAALWACLIAIGIGLLLVAGQNRYLRRKTLSVKEGSLAGAGGIVTGVLAGASSQTLFFFLSGIPEAATAGRVASWLLLGCGAGVGLSYFVPNLGRRRAAIGGTLGGVVAAYSFLTVVPTLGDTGGRLLAAAILGLFTGMMLVLVEAVSRKAWLVVHWGKNERSTVSLGATPIVIGNSGSAHVCLSWDPEAPAVMARVSHADGVVRIEDPTSGKSKVMKNGDKVAFGQVLVEVREAASSEGKTPTKDAAPTPTKDPRPRQRAGSR